MSTNVNVLYNNFPNVFDSATFEISDTVTIQFTTNTTATPPVVDVQVTDGINPLDFSITIKNAQDIQAILNRLVRIITPTV